MQALVCFQITQLRVSELGDIQQKTSSSTLRKQSRILWLGPAIMPLLL